MAIRSWIDVRSYLRNQPLTVRLLAYTLVALSGYVAIIGFFAYLSAKDSISDAYDESLIVNANALLFLMQEEVAEGGLTKPLNVEIPVDALKGEDKTIFETMAEYRMFRVWHNNKLIISSTDTLPAQIAPFPEGFSDQKVGTDEWRVYSLQVPKKSLIVELGELDEARERLVMSIAQDLVLPFMLTLPLAAFMFWRAIKAGMAGLHKVTGQVHARSPEQMLPLETASLPPDLLPLVEAINALLARLDQSLSRERQTTELAAHELRTPLTVIKLQAQMGLKAQTDEGRVEALRGLLEGVERGSHLVEQLLTLTRVEQSQFTLAPVKLAPVVHRAINELQPLSDKKGQRFKQSIDQDCTALANEDLVYLTLTNILSNAIKYSPDGAAIRVELANREKTVSLRITDEGPGIPEQMRSKIFERFFRFNPGQVLGSGLGLTIARQCAEIMKAELTLSDAPGGRGLLVELRLNPADAEKAHPALC